MKGLRILDTGLAPARWNVAMTAALAELHAGGRLVLHRPQRPRRDSPPPCREGLGVGGTPASEVLGSPPHCPSPTRGEGTLRRAPSLNCGHQVPVSDTVRFHRYRPCVLLGVGQEVQRAADVEYCRRAGIAIAHRVTGGGAVYMSPAMLAWDVVVDRAACGGALDAITRKVCGGVAAGLSRLGAKARFRPPNDMVIGDRKVSGSGGYVAGRSAVLQGTILLADEIPDMASALRLSESALRQRTTCLEIEIGAAPSLPSVVEVITEGLAEALDRKPVFGRLHQAELALCQALLRDEIGTDRYALGCTAAPA